MAGLSGLMCLLPFSNCLPTVDLGYNIQQPTLLNTQYNVYVFYDVRYAAPPTGINRFNAPVAPATNRSTVQTGGSQWACPQATPNWQPIPGQFFPQYQAGKTTFDPSNFQTGTPNTTPNARETEDCLFLDVYASKSVVDNAGTTTSRRKTKRGTGAPVIVQIYGGGYVNGVKDLNPTGWFVRDGEQGGSGIVFVSINYRLGAFGWLAGPTFQKDGSANAGLLDQNFALQWVKKYIAKFGGDPNNITIIGESAGGGSIMHQITANGSSSTTSPFQKAIIQSPGFYPIRDTAQTEKSLANFLQLLNVSTVAQARTLSFNQLYAANAIQVGNAPYGQFIYGPTVDGSFVPDLPSKLLAAGKFNHNVKVMVGHNVDEGIAFTSPFIQNDTAFRQFVTSALPPSVATPANINTIATSLYPDTLSGSQGYTNEIARADAVISDLVFTCNIIYLNRAFFNLTSAYLFAIPPAVHGQDVGFTYYTGPTSSASSDAQVNVAVNMQRSFLNFAKTGSPNGQGMVNWGTYGSGSGAMVKDFNITGGLAMIADPAASVPARCAWWQGNL